MASFLIYTLAVIGLLALIALALGLLLDGGEADERARIQMHVRSAERQLHEIARNSFEAMLEEARAHDPRGRR
jgi:hypothetical protein